MSKAGIDNLSALGNWRNHHVRQIKIAFTKRISEGQYNFYHVTIDELYSRMMKLEAELLLCQHQLAQEKNRE